MKLNDQNLSRREIERHSGDLAAAGGVRKVVLDDGSERGIRVLEFRTGSGLTFEVLSDRALDIGAAEYKGHSLGWHSATGFRHPGLHENADEHGLSWLRSFSGLQVTAGLDHTLGAEEVPATEYKYPSRPSMIHSLHGRVANIPARLNGYGETWNGEQCLLWAEGEVRQAAVFGEHLRLHRRIETRIGSKEILVHDTVRNFGFDRTPHMFLYHINLGWPLIDAGTRFFAPIIGTRWQSPTVATQRSSYQVMPGPSPGFLEQAYEHDLKPDSAGRMYVAVINERLKIGLTMEWYAAEFPSFFQWLHLREGAYAMGIEPSTHHMEGDMNARKDGCMIWLEHGECRSYRFVLTVLDGQEALESAVERIRRVAVQPDCDVPPLTRVNS